MDDFLKAMTTLRRWAKRDGCTVEWGNVVGGHRGQEFRETFAVKREAIEREKQANAGEAIREDRKPIAIKREQLHGD